jgi:hypothetical protein
VRTSLKDIAVDQERIKLDILNMPWDQPVKLGFGIIRLVIFS